MNRFILFTITLAVAVVSLGAAEQVAKYDTTFQGMSYGRTPAGWRDLVDYRPTRNWAVDGNGLLRVMLKEYVGEPDSGDRLIRREYLETYGMRHFAGMLAFEGRLSDDTTTDRLSDVIVTTQFRKTPDPNVYVGAFLRLRDRDHYYAARFRNAHLLEIMKYSDGVPTVLATRVTTRRYPEDENWTIEFSAQSDLFSAKLFDDKGTQVARCDARDDAYATGSVGLTATTFAGISTFSILASRDRAIEPQSAFATKTLESNAPAANDYVIVRAAEDHERLNMPLDRIASRYDIVVAGGGTGGFGAALQAARLGASVLLLEETDLIGGQMSNAGVTSMDEGGQWGKNSVRERGIYREFHESAVAHYYTLNKDPFTAYHYNRQSEAGFEPHVSRGILYGLIKETRLRKLPSQKPVVLDLALRTKVVSVAKQGNVVTGATLEEWNEQGPRHREVRCHILIDATEYGDVLPLAGVRYRVGACTSDEIESGSPMQEHTWLGVIREYLDGVPAHLQIKVPPPGYDEVVKRFKNYGVAGQSLPGKLHKGVKATRVWWDYVDWRGMPDSQCPATGELTEQRHTRCGLNGGNDYPVTAATCEDMEQRRRDELWGIHRTLGIIYWFQHELGLPWAPAEDEGYATSYNVAQMKARGVREDLLPIAALLPQCPYVRESRRMIGVETLRGRDIYVRDRDQDRARPWAASVAINDYSIDLHGTDDRLETGLDEPNYINSAGPFQVPFDVFIPETMDGFLPAEKNISQSRLVNGATRLQPSTMLNGQAAGTIAALAAQQGVQPRQINIISVQAVLLASGDTLIPRWYEDVSWSTPLWQATQLLSLYGMMDRPGAMTKNAPLGLGNRWGAEESLDPNDAAATLQRLATLVRDRSLATSATLDERQTRGDFALKVADLLRTHGSYQVGDPKPDDMTAYDRAVEKLRLIQQKKALKK